MNAQPTEAAGITAERPATRIELGITLFEGAVIVDPDGNEHIVTLLNKLQYNCVTFTTNTGLRIHKRWEDARRSEYTVLNTARTSPAT